eukprot:459177_1
MPELDDPDDQNLTLISELPIHMSTVQTTGSPTLKPSNSPTIKTTVSPTEPSSNPPTNRPTFKPTKRPTRKPTKRPTRKPTHHPTQSPTNEPTIQWDHMPQQNQKKPKKSARINKQNTYHDTSYQQTLDEHTRKLHMKHKSSGFIKLYLTHAEEVEILEAELMTHSPSDFFMITSIFQHNIDPSRAHRIEDYCGLMRTILVHLQSFLLLPLKCEYDTLWNALRSWLSETLAFMLVSGKSKTLLQVTRLKLKNILDVSYNQMTTNQRTVYTIINRDYHGNHRMEQMDSDVSSIPLNVFSDRNVTKMLCEFVDIALDSTLLLHQTEVLRILQHSHYAKDKMIPPMLAGSEFIQQPCQMYYNAMHDYLVILRQYYVNSDAYSNVELMGSLGDVMRSERMYKSRTGAVIIAAKIYEWTFISHDKWRDITVVLNNDRLVPVLSCLMEKMMNQPGKELHIIKYEAEVIKTAVKPKKKKTARKLQIFRIHKVDNFTNNPAAVTVRKVESVENCTDGTVHLYFTDKCDVDKFLTTIVEHRPSHLILEPVIGYSESKDNVIAYGNDFDEYFEQNMRFIVTEPGASYYNILKWFDMTLAKLKFTQLNNVDSPLFRSIYSELLKRYRYSDRKIPIYSKLLVYIRMRGSGNTQNSSKPEIGVPDIIECIDLILNFVDISIDKAYQFRKQRILNILNGSNFSTHGVDTLDLWKTLKIVDEKFYQVQADAMNALGKAYLTHTFGFEAKTAVSKFIYFCQTVEALFSSLSITDAIYRWKVDKQWKHDISVVVFRLKSVTSYQIEELLTGLYLKTGLKMMTKKLNAIPSETTTGSLPGFDLSNYDRI